MSTLGKVLTFFNVVAAILLLVMAGKDYGASRAMRASAFRHEFFIIGVPVDEKESTVGSPDDPIAAKLSPDTLIDIFANAKGGDDLGGGAVKTVLEELKRVRTKVAGNITAQPAGDLQKRKAYGYLILQAKNIGERAELTALITNQPIGDAIGNLQNRFDAVMSLYGNAENPNWDGVRYAAAPLLVSLSFDPAWLERVRVILGLDAFIYGLESSAYVMEQIAADVKMGIIADQGGFVRQYLEMIEFLKLEGENLYQADKRLAELKQLVAERKMEVAQRLTEVNKNKQELAQLGTETNSELAKLDAIQRDLFALQQRVAVAVEGTRSLEEQLRKKASARP